METTFVPKFAPGIVDAAMFTINYKIISKVSKICCFCEQSVFIRVDCTSLIPLIVNSFLELID